MSQVGGRFLSKAREKWWKYEIALEFRISPVEVDSWETDDVLEALANIAIRRARGG